jgi:fructose-bisphosphate aldolase class I
LKTWKGDPNNLKAAQEALIKVAEANGQATKGEYKGGALASESLYVKNYTY